MPTDVTGDRYSRIRAFLQGCGGGGGGEGGCGGCAGWGMK